MRNLRHTAYLRVSVKYVGDRSVHSGLTGQKPGQGAYPCAARSTG